MEWFHFDYAPLIGGPPYRFKCRLIAIARGSVETLWVSHLVWSVERSVKSGLMQQSELDDILARIAVMKRLYPKKLISVETQRGTWLEKR